MSILLQLFLSFAKVGVLSFGGGMAVISLIYDEIQSFGNISAEQFANMVAISQATPGPVAVNVATFIGYESAGFAGALVATLGVSLPCFVIMLIVCRAIGNKLNNKYIRGALEWVKPACVGMIASAFWVLLLPAIAGNTRIGGFFENMPIDPIAVAMVIATVLLVGKFKKNPIIVILIMGCIGALLSI